MVQITFSYAITLIFY